jgi:FAD/FMN-containing dehydrogenase
MNRVTPDATAFGYRNSDVMILCPSFMPPAATSDQEAKILAAWKTLASKGQGAYSGFISTRTTEDVTKIYPPTTYERLKQIKKKYDPENIFNQNFNIQP